MGFRVLMAHPYDPECEYLKTNEGCYYCCHLCDTDMHRCGGCGGAVSHLGNDHDDASWRHLCEFPRC